MFFAICRQETLINLTDFIFLQEIQKWVTLQPDTDYNPRVRKNSKIKDEKIENEKKNIIKK